MTVLQQTAAEETAGPLWERWTQAHTRAIALVTVAFGFVLRVKEAWGTFLNPDEALHFFIANRTSLAAAYRANLTMAHPPLLTVLLYGLRSFGSSEFMLRLPSILAGTLFCWIFFKWLSRLAGVSNGLVGLVLATLLPPMISLSAEVRHYGLLLLFLVSGAWFLERGLAENSPRLMLVSASCLYLAMLSHYSAFLFVPAVAVYALVRIRSAGSSIRTAMAWAAGQTGALALAVFLYSTHISKIKGTTMADQAFEVWLRKSYFHRGQENWLAFLVTRSFSVFQYTFGQLVIGDLAALAFIAGIVFLLQQKAPLSRPGPQPRELALLLVLPFLLNYGTALTDVYPYGGTRHCVFLAIFAIAGISVYVAKLAGQHVVRAVAVAAMIVVLCHLFATVHQPHLARADQTRVQMEHAIAFVQENIPASEPLFVDYESGIELGHYLCEQRPVSYDRSIPGFLVFHCGGHRVISTVPDLWAFSSPVFLSQWAKLVQGGYLKSGEGVWIVQAGWMVKLDEELQKEFPEFRDLKTQAFENNIRFFKLTVGQSMPSVADSSETIAPEPR